MKLRVRATPNASRSEIAGWEQDPIVGRLLRVRLAAPPSDGKANKELQRVLAKALRLPRSAVRLEKGSSSRLKTLTLPDEAASILEQLERGL